MFCFASSQTLRLSECKHLVFAQIPSSRLTPLLRNYRRRRKGTAFWLLSGCSWAPCNFPGRGYTTIRALIYVIFKTFMLSFPYFFQVLEQRCPKGKIRSFSRSSREFSVGWPGTKLHLICVCLNNLKLYSQFVRINRHTCFHVVIFFVFLPLSFKDTFQIFSSKCRYAECMQE